MTSRPAAVLRSTLFDGDDEYLITSYAFDAAGNLELATDPRGIVTRKTYDPLGRVTAIREAYDASVNGGDPLGDKNQATSYQYTGLDQVKEMQVSVAGAPPAGTVTRTTTYSYGVVFGNSDQFENKDLLFLTTYPGYSSGTPAYFTEQRFYNALGELTNKKDPSDIKHEYKRDQLGNIFEDYASFNDRPTGVDGAVRYHLYEYDALGRAVLLTSANESRGEVNQVKRVFNGFGQLTSEATAHTGKVTTSTPSVRYVYEFQSNSSRLSKLIYPNQRELTYNYNVPGNPSAISSISENGQPLESYQYLGLIQIVERNRTEPGLRQTYIAQPGDTNGPKKPDGTPRNDSGSSDPYTGLDRFGRVIDQNWINTTSNTSILRDQFAYDADSNRLSSLNVMTQGSGQSQLYQPNGASAAGAYDALNRRTDYRGGTLTQLSSTTRLNTINPADELQTWSANARGDYRRTGDDPAKTRPVVQAPTDSQKVRANLDVVGMRLNEPTSALSVQFDAWGQMTAVCDWQVAWIVEDDELKHPNPAARNSAAFTYDALGRRISQNGTQLFFYGADGQVLEERTAGSSAASVQHVWSPDGQLVLRDRDTVAGSGDLGRTGSGGHGKLITRGQAIVELGNQGTRSPPRHAGARLAECTLSSTSADFQRLCDGGEAVEQEGFEFRREF